MVDKTNNENVKMQDLELILEVNRKAIEIETEVVDQNEEIIKLLTNISDTQEDVEEKIDKIIDQVEKTNKDIFKIQILFVTGLASIIIQIVQIFTKH